MAWKNRIRHGKAMRLTPTLRDPQPSQEDRVLTTRLVAAGKLLGIEVLDHLIIGDGTSDYFSFADAGSLHQERH
jgi:hypothetical protein